MDLDTLLTRFEAEHLEPRSITPDRRGEQLVVLRALAAELDGPLFAMTPGDLSAYVGRQIASGLHPNTVRKKLYMVKPFLGWASEAGLIDDLTSMRLQSVRNPRGSTARTTPRPYTAKQIHEFYAALAEKYPVLPSEGTGSRLFKRYLNGTTRRLKGRLWRHARRLQFEAQVALALNQGLRSIEIYSLSVAALHHDNDELIVLTAKQEPGHEVRRTLPYMTHARACVEEWLDFRRVIGGNGHDRPWLTLDYCEGPEVQTLPQTHRAFSESLYKAFGGAWEWHRFRHTAATEWLRSGVSLEKLRVYMGHSSIEQTLAYAEIANSDVEQEFSAAEADFTKRLGLTT